MSKNYKRCHSGEEDLLLNIEQNNIEAIKRAIDEKPELLAYTAYSLKLLKIACSMQNIKPETVSVLLDRILQNDEDIVENSSLLLLHVAVANPNSEILKIIVEKLPNKMICMFGVTALQTLIKHHCTNDNENMFVENVKILLQAEIDVNHSNISNESAIVLAAEKGLSLIVKTILEHSSMHVDIDNHKINGKAARELIQEKKLYAKPLPEKPVYLSPKERLFAVLKDCNEDKFIQYFDEFVRENTEDVSIINDGTSTILQISCAERLTKVVRHLLENGVRSRVKTRNNKKFPIEIATHLNYYEIFDLLLDFDDCYMPSDIFFYILENSNEECCRIVLKRMEESKFLNVDEKDFYGNTPIYYALRYCSDEIIFWLLNLGASLVIKNKLGKMPIQNLDPKLLEKVLDHFISQNEILKIEEIIAVYFRYGNILPQGREKHHTESVEDYVLESQVIDVLIDSAEYKSLLNHPLIVSYLLMKWNRMKSIFYTNLLFYIVFSISLLIFILSFYVKNDEDSSDFTYKISYILLQMTYFILVLREVFQLIIAPATYLKKFDNYVECILILFVGLILYGNTINYRKSFASFSIISAAFGLFLMIEHIPTLSKYVVMLKTVSFNFFKLFMSYSLLIVAFAQSFNILFTNTNAIKVNNNRINNTEEDPFHSLEKSLFKTFIMLTGEFDASSINFESNPVFSELIFTLFIFIIAIVLLNLLNGLAVSDIQKIENDAEHMGHIFRAKYVINVEKMLSRNILPKWLLQFFPEEQSARFNFIKSFIRKQVSLFEGENTELEFFPHDDRKILLYDDYSIYEYINYEYTTCTKYCSYSKLDETSTKRVFAILKKKKGRTTEHSSDNYSDLISKIDALSEKFDELNQKVSLKSNE